MSMPLASLDHYGAENSVSGINVSWILRAPRPSFPSRPPRLPFRPPALEHLQVVRAFEGGGFGAVGEVHAALHLVQAVVPVFLQPAHQPVAQLAQARRPVT